jgi:iron complex transport system ATP-binding protein
LPDIRPCIQITNLQFEWTSSPIYRNLNLQIPQNILSVLTGRNPAVWNALLRMISGTQAIQSGQIDLWGVPVGHFGRRGLSSLICYVPRQQQPLFAYPVKEFIMQGCESRLKPMQTPQIADIELAQQIMSRLKIQKLNNRDCSLLNKAERQLVLLARALMQNAQLLMLDDPVHYLDGSEQFSIMKMLLEMAHQQNKTVVVALSDPWLGLMLADQLVVFDDHNVAAALDRQQPDFAEAAESVLHRVLPLDAECHLLDPAAQLSGTDAAPESPAGQNADKPPKPKGGFLF